MFAVVGRLSTCAGAPRMKESFFLSEEGLSPQYVPLTHTLCNVPPNRGFFLCAGEAKCSEVWKPDTRIVKSSSNGP